MLKVGDVVEFRGQLWEVDYVNQCRARIVPLERREVVIPGVDGEEERRFFTKDKALSIAPESDLPVMKEKKGRIGRASRRKGKG